MAEGGVDKSDKRENRLDCTICLESFKSPKLLPCFHTFCAPCLKKYIEKAGKDGEFECPLCRKPVAIPSKGADGFQSNFYIDTSLEGPWDDIQCDICEPETTASHRCLECEENFCGTCTETHTKMKATRQHELMELKTIDSTRKRNIISRKFCNEHSDQQLLFYCKQCATPLCVVCKLTGHENHVTKDVVTAANEIRSQLSATTDEGQLNESISILQAAIVHARTLKSELANASKEGLGAIKRQGDILHQHIEDFVQKKEKELIDYVKKEDEDLDKELAMLSKDLESRVSFKDICKLMLEHSGDMEMMEKGPELCKMLETAIKPAVHGRRYVTHEMFVPGTTCKVALETVFGMVQECVLRAAPFAENVKLTSQFKVSEAKKYITALAVTDNAAWISWLGGKEVVLVDNQGKTAKTIALKEECNFVGVDKEMQCVVSCDGSKCIKRIHDDGTEDILATLQGPYTHPQGFCFRNSSRGGNELLYCCADGGFYACTKGEVRFVSSSTDLGRVFASEMQNPIRISVEKYSGMVGTCEFSAGHVMLYDSDLKLKVKQDFPNACGLCFYNEGYILIAKITNGVWIMRTDGTQMTQLLPHKTVSAIAMDSKDNLWLGTKDGDIELYKFG